MELPDVFDRYDQLLPVHKWPPMARTAIGSVKVTKLNRTAGDGIQEDVVEVKRLNPDTALTLLFKHLNLLTERLHLSADEDVIKILEGARTRVEEGRALEAARQPAAAKAGTEDVVETLLRGRKG